MANRIHKIRITNPTVILTFLASMVAVALSFAISSNYTTLIMIILGCIAIACIMNPFFGLILALICLYNPYFNYRYLFIGQWTGGHIRAGISLSFIVIILIGIFLKTIIAGKIKRTCTPLDLTLNIFMIFSIIAVFMGFIRGNEPREIFAEFFPILEFYVFFFFTTFIIKTERQIKRLGYNVLVWAVFVVLIEIGLYFIQGQNFLTKSQIGNVILPKLDEFMPALFFPLLLSIYFYARVKKLKRWIALSCIIMLMAVIISLYRSLWLGVILSSLFIIWKVRLRSNKSKIFIKVLPLIFVSFFALNLIAQHYIVPLKKYSIFNMFLGRSMQTIDTYRLVSGSEAGRLLLASDLFAELFKVPIWGVGFGGKFRGTSGNLYTYSHTSYYFLRLGNYVGIVGILWLSFLIIQFLKIGLRIFNTIEMNRYKGVVLGVLGSYISMGVVFTFFPAPLHFPIPAYLGVGGALIFIIKNIECKHCDKKIK